MAVPAQAMECVEVFLTQPSPSLAVSRRPKITGQAADEALAPIVDFDEGLFAVIAAIHASMSTPHQLLTRGARLAGAFCFLILVGLRLRFNEGEPNYERACPALGAINGRNVIDRIFRTYGRN